MLSRRRISAFQKKVLGHFADHGRDFPWRRTRQPYRILVSEIMLQQTQTDRVIGKYREFLKAFPSFRALAKASTADVLRAWQGLGYNRRALSLKRCAELVINEYNGKLPRDPELLQQLPGIGPYTAAAVACFAFDAPAVFIETNIRAVYLHEFFKRGNIVSDAKLLLLVEQTIDREDPRRWYYALMDKGSALKKDHRHLTKMSAHYVQQSPFKGSNRQIRGAILRTVTKARRISVVKLRNELSWAGERFDSNLAALTREGFLMLQRNSVLLQG